MLITFSKLRITSGALIVHTYNISAISTGLPASLAGSFASNSDTFTKSHQNNQPFKHKIFLAMTNSNFFLI
jgi:hypothetical protein